MIGWRRRAKAARETTVTPERLYELVSQTLMENFGPLGSFAISRRQASHTDDIFHTVLARSVAHDIVANLAEHGVVLKAGGAADAAATASPATPSARAAAARGATGVAPVVSIGSSIGSSAGRTAPLEVAAANAPAASATAPAASTGHGAIGRSVRSVTPAFPFTGPLTPVDSVAVPRQLAAAVSAAGSRPAIAAEPLDDDALRALVAHHSEVEAAVAAKAGEARPAPTIAI
jgi:hypothetical protein